MITEFLRQYQDELFNRKGQIKDEIEEIKTKLAEEEKFVEILEKENDSFIADFTPRDLNSKNKAKAKEVRNLIKSLLENKDNLNTELNDIDSKLDDISSMLSEVKKLESLKKKLDSNKDKKDETVNKEQIIDNLSNISDYILLDPQRAKMEIESLITRLQ